MKITWYGTAAVMLESDGCKIVFDPFLQIPLKDTPLRRKLLANHFRQADAVLVTHGHFDHILDIPRLYQNSDREIYATATPCRTLMEKGFPMKRLHRIFPGSLLTLGGFSISVYQGRHCRFDLGVVRKTLFKADTLRNPKRLMQLWKLNKRYPEDGETLFYEIEAEGKRVQLMGSMGVDAETDYPTGADVLILPFQGTGDPAKTVAPIIEKLQPKSILLDHYDDAFPPLSTQIPTTGFVADMLRKGVPTAAMKNGKTYII